ncbi:winged helix-turn-helix domain-containing protein [Vagococcus sp. WN89Y]|uniref:winged helix-turn-helix domain-containing protein n=1 Tax=Vagococcus sp. WN89Y TaxID=3457258 RepID=UPI003FCCCF62
MNNDVMDGGSICFLNFTFNRKLRTLQRSDEVIQLRKKEADVLALLCDKFPNPVSQNDFLSEVWGGSYVTSQSIAQVIRSLRLILCDEKKNIILTIPKLGYKLAVTPTVIEAASARQSHDETTTNVNGKQGPVTIVPGAINLISSYISAMPLISLAQPDKKSSVFKKVLLSGFILFFSGLACWTLSYESCSFGFNKDKCEVDLSVSKQYSPGLKEDLFSTPEEDSKEYPMP